jgi:hypothetical protein
VEDGAGRERKGVRRGRYNFLVLSDSRPIRRPLLMNVRNDTEEVQDTRQQIPLRTAIDGIRWFFNYFSCCERIPEDREKPL